MKKEEGDGVFIPIDNVWYCSVSNDYNVSLSHQVSQKSKRKQEKVKKKKLKTIIPVV